MEAGLRRYRPGDLLLEVDLARAYQAPIHRQNLAPHVDLQRPGDTNTPTSGVSFYRMEKPITVKILVAVNDIAQFDACTLCCETLRVGWPTAHIYVYVNGGAHYGDIADKLQRFNVLPVDLFSTKPIHHPDWIRQQVLQKSPGPLVIADPDIVYWKSCEDWEFNSETLLAGHANPRMWNDFARCVSVPRIHTHMMVFPDTKRLRNEIILAYPPAYEPFGEFCSFDPFKGRVMFEEGHPVFWDNCANLYSMLGAGRVKHFTTEHTQCYDHLNSASYYEFIRDRVDPATKAGFTYAYGEWLKNPRPGLWPMMDRYYEQKAIEARVKQPQL